MDLSQIQEILREVARGEQDSLASSVGRLAPQEIEHSTVDLNYLKVDPNGRPMVRELVKLVASRIVDYAIPRSKINRALKEVQTTGSTIAFQRLSSEAISLFTKITKTGEGGELLLFALSESYLKLPQILTKMDLKTDSQVHFHGADGVFLGTHDDSLAIYWGESKLHESHSSAVAECIESIAPVLKVEESSDRDFQLLDRIDLDNTQLENALYGYFDYNSPNYGNLKNCSVCLVGFDYKKYISGGTPLKNKAIEEEIEKSFNKNWKGTLKNHLQKNELDIHRIILFYLPMKSVQDFRDNFRAELRLGELNE